MKTKLSTIGDLSADELLQALERILAHTAVVLANTVETLEAGALPDGKVVVGQADRYTTAVQQVISERDKVGKVRNQIAGTVGGRTLDLDAARVEIGRRLACLRDG